MSDSHRKLSLLCSSLLGTVMASSSMAAITVNQTTNTTTLRSALGGNGLVIDSVSIVSGAATQFGTYSGFNTPPVTFGNGVVLSTGLVGDTPGLNGFPTTDIGGAGAAEFDSYGIGHIENFSSSHDVAALQVNFTLAQASAVAFDFIFGSVEYPDYTNNYTDAFLAFLDGTTNQVAFDGLGAPVQVGTSFASQLTTGDLNTVFTDPYGLLRPLTTKTGVLAAGAHTLLFEVGDVNDGILDSAVFIRNFSTTTGGDDGGPITAPTVPLPAAAWLFGGCLLGLSGRVFQRRRV